MSAIHSKASHFYSGVTRFKSL